MEFENGSFGQVFLYVAIGLGILILVLIAACLRWWYKICCCGSLSKSKVKVKVDTKVDTKIKSQMHMAQSSKPSIVYQSSPPMAFMVPPSQMVSCMPMSTNVQMGVTYPMGPQVGSVHPVHHGFGGPVNPIGYQNHQVFPGNPIILGQQGNQMVYPNQITQLPPNQQICNKPEPQPRHKRAFMALKTRILTTFRKCFYPPSRNPDMAQKVDNAQKVQSNYNAPMTQGNYNAPMSQTNYNAPMTQTNYNVPTTQNNYNAPMAESNHNAPMAQKNYNAQMSQKNYNAPMTQNNYNDQMAENNYNAQIAQNNYNAPMTQNNCNAQMSSGYPVQQSQYPQNQINQGQIMNVDKQTTGAMDNQGPTNQVNNIGAPPNHCQENGNKV